ncbi:hypothetical protein SCOR_07145 [Sulfidibacter corallicola]|uniref:Uncharacterized protein n=1 Tax=Sulfidibacter corallicola TaxID=2818388 RepID=A0A8A4TR18_SULCO|nr:hypothetical protein [Sulfidibacter corallicola]QTD51458.1 hypothetical protein J3U87_03225 [Sulfidibacter corallicola]
MEVYYLRAVRTVSAQLEKVQHLEKWMLFALASPCAAFIGSLWGQVANPFPRQGSGLMAGTLYTAVWVAWIGFSIGGTVAVIQNWYMQRLETAGRALATAVGYATLGGFLGGVALVIVKVTLATIEGMLFKSATMAHIAGWTAESLVLAAFISRSIPNLPMKRALIAGSIAGFLGGFATGISIPAALGDSLKGVLLGLAIGLVEKVAREAWIEVHRDFSAEAASGSIVMMNQVPKINLGENPLRVGSTPDCEIFVRSGDDKSEVLKTLTFKDQRIFVKDQDSGIERQMDDGQSVRVANVTLKAFLKRKPS